MRVCAAFAAVEDTSERHGKPQRDRPHRTSSPCPDAIPLVTLRDRGERSSSLLWPTRIAVDVSGKSFRRIRESRTRGGFEGSPDRAEGPAFMSYSGHPSCPALPQRPDPPRRSSGPAQVAGPRKSPGQQGRQAGCGRRSLGAWQPGSQDPVDQDVPGPAGGSQHGQTRDIDDRLTIIAAGGGIGITPEGTTAQYRRDGVVFRPLRDAPPIAVQMIWRRHDPHPAASCPGRGCRCAASMRL